ncbi:MAG: M56 family metallopeptidase [Euryarchaeota archaeon]|nr:M56 family metallopeptidase [Euryarchaeota archaeon]
MNSLHLILYYILLTGVIFLVNELLILVYDPSIRTRNRIHKLTMISFFAVFFIVPFKIIQGLLIQGSQIIKKDSVIILADKVDYITAYTTFARLTALLIFIAFSISLFIIFFDNKLIYKLYNLHSSKNEEIKKKVREVAAEVGVNPPEIYSAANSLDVFAFGLKPKLALGEEFMKISTDKEFKIVLKHELWHIKNRDLLTKALSLLLRIFFFYNPVIFMLTRKIEKESEYMADLFSVKTKKEKRTYIKLMLKLNSINSFRISSNPEASNIFPMDYPGMRIRLDRDFPSKRIENLFKIRKSKKFLSIASLFCTVFLMAAGISLGNSLARENGLDSGSRTLYFDTGAYSMDTTIMKEQEYIFIHKTDFKISKNEIEGKIERLEYKTGRCELLVLSKDKEFSKETQKCLDNLKQDLMDHSSFTFNTGAMELSEGSSNLKELGDKLIDANATMDANATLNTNSTIDANATMDANATLNTNSTIDLNATMDANATLNTNSTIDLNATMDANATLNTNSTIITDN